MSTAWGFKMESVAPAFARKYGPWALVTGASEGIGRAFTVELARSGVNAVLVAQRQPQLEQLAKSLTAAHGVQCQVVMANLSHPEGVRQVLACTADHDVGLEVCAAGFGTSGPFLQDDLPSELDMLQVNCGALAALSWGPGQPGRAGPQGHGAAWVAAQAAWLFLGRLAALGPVQDHGQGHGRHGPPGLSLGPCLRQNRTP